MPQRRRKSRSEHASADPLRRVLGESEQVQERVETAAVDLSSVNNVLKHEVRKSGPLNVVVDALDRSMEVEANVQRAAEELESVNDALAAEIDDRVAIQRKLDHSQAALMVSRVREKRARHVALHDDITGLPNAALFKDRLESALAQAHRHSWAVAVMFIDLDGFKQVNDTHGHDVGDALLRLVADRLQEYVREGDTVCRRSGDEFLYLMLEAGDEENARVMAQRLIAMIAAPCIVSDVKFSVQASVGLAMYPEHGTTPAELLKRADLAMYEAKRQPSGAVPPSDADSVPPEGEPGSKADA